MAVAERTRGIRERPSPPVSLKYVAGSAVQFRLFSSLKLNGKQLFGHRVAQHWTLHSGRNFLPSATADLGYQKTDRDILGGWSAQASDRDMRLAKQRITVLQLVVAYVLKLRCEVQSTAPVLCVNLR